MKRSSERGNAIFMLFIAVAMFGLLSFAFLQGSRSNTSMITSEASKASTYNFQDCANATNMGLKRLEARGCGSLISYNTDGSNSNIGAPTDGSCSIYHPNGGGVKVCVSIDPETLCDTKTMTIGDACDGMIYVGLSPDGGKRMFAAPADEPGLLTYTSIVSPTAFGIYSATDGDGNTAALITHSSPAGSACANLVYAGRSDWYLPARNELPLLYNQRVVLNLNAAYPGYYMSSTEVNDYSEISLEMGTGNSAFGWDKNDGIRVRCVRKAS